MMTFEDLEAWKEARKTVNLVYDLTKVSTIQKDFGLCSQIQRAAVSAMTNVAEGFERVGEKEKANFYNIPEHLWVRCAPLVMSSKTITRNSKTK